MQAEINARTRLEAELHQALEQGELSLYYQPQIHHGQPCRSVEALLRWHSPQHGLMLPGAFIALAEQSNLILAIDHWVLQQACIQLAEWAKDPVTAALSIAVNVSAPVPPDRLCCPGQPFAAGKRCQPGIAETGNHRKPAADEAGRRGLQNE
jgi:sensor c-di-GMP phosphodiesterase-like protein